MTRENWHRHHRRIRIEAGYDPQASDGEGCDIVADEDDFDDYEFTGWRQACRDILYLIYYDEDAGEFTGELSEGKLGALWEDYLQVVSEPICFDQIKHRLFLGRDYAGDERHYRDADGFLCDMHRVIQNCKKFNSRKSDLYRRAKKIGKMILALENELADQLLLPE